MERRGSRPPEAPSGGEWSALAIGFMLIAAFVYYFPDIMSWLGKCGVGLYEAVVRWF